MAGNLRRNIEVTNGQENHVREVVEATVTRGPGFNNFDNAVKPFTDSIRQISIGEGNDVIKVIFQRADKLAQ